MFKKQFYGKCQRKYVLLISILFVFCVQVNVRANPKMLPDVPKGENQFRAYYTRQNYTEEWEQSWRVGKFADVLVTFEGRDIGFMFWRGTSYIPHWISENGIWYNNQFVERRANADGLKGCIEPMSDKRCRYSHVRIIENNEVRKIVHWRYAPVDLEYRRPYVDLETDEGDWVDEYYIIYPDASAVRSATLYSTAINEFTDWQESIVVNQPGTGPEDNIDSKAISISNLKGEVAYYSWPETADNGMNNLPAGSCIQVVNIKSDIKPYIVVPPDPALKIFPFRKHSPISIFHWWDHWPVSMGKSSSHKAEDKFKPSHTSLTCWKGWEPYSTSDNSKTYVMLHGMTNKPVEQLIDLAKSWLQPAKIEEISEGYTYEGYDRQEKAYCIKSAANPPKPLLFMVASSKTHPLYNPAFIIHNWGDKQTKVEVKGGSQKPEEIKQAIECGLDGNNLVLWIKMNALQNVSFSISPI